MLKSCLSTAEDTENIKPTHIYEVAASSHTNVADNLKIKTKQIINPFVAPWGITWGVLKTRLGLVLTSR
jgi:hypothetical protein